MDFKQNPLLLLCIGFLVGIVAAEVMYYLFSPIVLPEGAIDIVTDRDYYPSVSAVLSGARESIHVIMFSANYQTGPDYKDSTVNSLISELVAARNRGVDVEVVMDSWPEGNEKTFNYLRNNNVKVKMIKIDGSTHDKLIIVDGGVVVVGSTNWSHYAIDKNHEANVIINNGRVAQEFEAYFEQVAV